MDETNTEKRLQQYDQILSIYRKLEQTNKKKQFPTLSFYFIAIANGAKKNKTLSLSLYQH